MNMTCILCNKPLTEKITFSYIVSLKKVQEECLCQDCRSKFISLTGQPTCIGCGRVSDVAHCYDCQRWKKEFPTVPIEHYALYQYNDWMKNWIEQFKYKGDYRLAKIFAARLKKELSGKEFRQALIVPIPISETSYQNRGFNQVEALLDFAMIPYHSILKNTSDEKKQSTKNRTERLLTEQPFSWYDQELVSSIRIMKRPIVLVDDVYTTGRTLLHAKKFLLDSAIPIGKSISLAR